MDFGTLDRPKTLPRRPTSIKNRSKLDPKMQELSRKQNQEQSLTHDYQKHETEWRRPPKLLLNHKTPKKKWGGGTPPQGVFHLPPNSGRRVGRESPGLRILLLISFRILLLRGSCLPPPKSSPSKPGPTPSSAAICGAGASWRLLGRKIVFQEAFKN